MASAQDLFRAKAPAIMDRLMADLGWTEQDAAADLGNLGQECGGFTLLQEQKPLVAGSQGGFGWYQWTGPRRRAYFAWCAANKLNPADDEANYAYHLVELRGEYKAVVAKVAAAKTLEDKVYAFERGYERAGMPNYPSRNRWAKIALKAWLSAHTAKPAGKPASVQTPAPAAPDTAPAPKPAPVPPPAASGREPQPLPAPVKKKWWQGIGAALGIGTTAGAAALHSGDWIWFGGIALIIVVLVAVWLHGRKA